MHLIIYFKHKSKHKLDSVAVDLDRRCQLLFSVVLFVEVCNFRDFCGGGTLGYFSFSLLCFYKNFSEKYFFFPIFKYFLSFFVLIYFFFMLWSKAYLTVPSKCLWAEEAFSFARVPKRLYQINIIYDLPDKHFSPPHNWKNS